MRWILVVLLALGGALVAVDRYYPDFWELLGPRKEQGDPLDFLRDLPEPKPREPKPPAPGPASRSRSRTPVEPAPAPDPPEQAVENQVPNQEVARVLLQILAARKLADDLSISVTDEEVILYGEPSSREKAEQILEIVEKGRESRRINTEHFRFAEKP